MCERYDITPLKFMLPSPFHIMYKLCESHDKTRMFLVCCARIFIGVIIFLYLIDQEKYMRMPPYQIFVYIVLGYTIVNMAILILIVMKQQKWPKGTRLNGGKKEEENKEPEVVVNINPENLNFDDKHIIGHTPEITVYMEPRRDTPVD